MEFTATILRYIYSMQFMWLLATLIIQPASPFGADVVCPWLPLTEQQVELCEEYPELISHLFMHTVNLTTKYLEKHFKHDRWNGTNVIPPIFNSTEEFLKLETRESAFVYALTSAAVVHSIAEICAKKRLSYCDCDKSLKNKNLPSGEKWVGCSPNIHFSIRFAQQFLDQRPKEDDTVEHKVFVTHNNNIGRLAVQEYMYKKCECIDAHKSCSEEACMKILPTMEDIATRLRKNYDKSVHAKIIISSARSDEILVVNRDTNNKVLPNKTIHFKPSLDFCLPNKQYKIEGVAGRECTVNENKTSSSSHCDNLCCDHGYEEYTVAESKPCNCKFVWCCRAECETCFVNKTKYRCKSKQ